MSDGIAPASGAAPSNGAAPRNNAGQFSPKAGATGVAAPEATSGATTGSTNAPASGPTTVAEWEGYEGEVEVYGEKVPVKVKSKAEALRAHQELMAYRKRVRDIAAAEKRIAEHQRMSPEERARAEGIDIDEIARRKVMQAARMVDMTPEQIEAHNVRQELEALKQERAQREQSEKQQADAEATRQRRVRAVQGLEKGLELSGLPKTHHTMALLAEIQQECVAQRLPPLPPDLLAEEANKRYAERGIEPLRKLQGKALLDRLGPDVERAVLLAVREKRGLAAAQPRQNTQPVARELPASDSEGVYGEAEAEARLRAMRNRS